MITSLKLALETERDESWRLLRHLSGLGKRFLYNSELASILESYRASMKGEPGVESPLGRVLESVVEMCILESRISLALRDGVANMQFFIVDLDQRSVDRSGINRYLRFKEEIVDSDHAGRDWTLTVDLSPFERDFPKLKQSSSIGRGVEFLNRHLSGHLFDRRQRGNVELFEFLKVHKCQGRQLMLNESVGGYDQFLEALKTAEATLDRLPEDCPLAEVHEKLRPIGFEPGWGRSVPQMREMMDLLTDVLEVPSPGELASFLSRIPMIFSLAIISPHGYFGQSDVLGLPDTGGQVVYILDQVRALEREMRASIRDQGLEVEPEILVITRLIPEAGGTSCDQPLEAIEGTSRARIVRVPFHDADGGVVPQWISRFKIWPYLERFAVDAEEAILRELGGKPDLIIGNYSDGNLVGSILAQRMKVTQCNIAHALEKSKYFNSDLYWRDFEEENSFSCQYTADLISMNTADFIVTSTFQEIAGTEKSVGQYEDYSAYTMPGLYRVRSGIDVYDPKFNIVSPGADPDTFFPASEAERRPEDLRAWARKLVFGEMGGRARGNLTDQDKPLIFAMSRLDRIKNCVAFVEAFALDEKLAEKANLLLVGGFIDPENSRDADEKKQIELMLAHFDRFGLEGKVRWVEMQTEKTLVGELYRLVAETGGVFVQPALYEAFGLTVIEAMATGLPTFATNRGGPLEIIEDGRSGFHIDPHRLDSATRSMEEFFSRCAADSSYWGSISKQALDRVATRYTWELYAQKLLAQSRIYGFWKYITNIQRQETRRYLEMFYGLLFRPLAARLDGRQSGLPYNPLPGVLGEKTGES